MANKDKAPKAPAKKPVPASDVVSGEDAARWAEGEPPSPAAPKTDAVKPANDEARRSRIGLVPDGDVRLSINIRKDLHSRLTVYVAMENAKRTRDGRRITAGEVIEAWIQAHTPEIPKS